MCEEITMFSWFNCKKSDSEYMDLMTNDQNRTKMIENLVRKRKKIQISSYALLIILVFLLIFELSSGTISHFISIYPILGIFYCTIRFELVDFKTKVVKSMSSQPGSQPGSSQPGANLD